MAEPGKLQWDEAGSALSECDVANVANTPEGVVVSFGRRRPGAQGEWQVQRLHQLLLSPAAAAGLRQMLARLLADRQGAGG